MVVKKIMYCYTNESLYVFLLILYSCAAVPGELWLH